MATESVNAKPEAGKSLIRYDAACRALAAAKATDEVKDIRDKAEAMRAYARQAKNKQLEVDATEIRIRSERRLGELLKAQKATLGLATGGTHGGRRSKLGAVREPSSDAPPTLADAGIDKKLSARSQKLAAVPEEKFEGLMAGWRERVKQENERVTTKLLHEGEKQEQAEQFGAMASAAMPEGRYGCIVVDPPWPMQKIERDVAPNQVGFEYPTMTEEELAALQLPATDDCHLFLWTTHKFLPIALRLLEVWGFKYVCAFVWHKPGGFQPFGLPQYNCEFALYARRGSPSFLETKAFPCCFNAPRREHSRKPDEFYETVKRVTAGPRIDIFSRQPRDGFDQFGNETDKFEVAS